MSVKSDLASVRSFADQLRRHARKAREYRNDPYTPSKWTKELSGFVFQSLVDLDGMNCHEDVIAAKEDLVRAFGEFVRDFSAYCERSGVDPEPLLAQFPQI